MKSKEAQRILTIPERSYVIALDLREMKTSEEWRR